MQAIYQIKSLLRQPSCWFWSLAFPLILGTLFYFMFGSINEKEAFQKVPVGIIGEEKAEEHFTDIIDEAELEEGKKMFSVKIYSSKEKALNALKNDNIQGVIDLDKDYQLTVKESSTNTSFIKMFVEQYKQNAMMINDLIKKDPMLAQNYITNLTNDTFSEIGINGIKLKGEDKDPYSQYFYALLAMTCLIASSMGAMIGNRVQANTSALGARRNIAPTSKMKQVWVDFLAGYVLFCAMAAIVLWVCIVFFKRDFGNNALLILLTTFIGIFCGMAGGMAISVCCKGSERKKDGLCVAFFMGSSFLAGLQWGNITYVIEKNIPIINRINPATLIVNSYKSLAVFGDLHKFTINIATLLGIGVALMIISVLKLRRTKYASI